MDSPGSNVLLQNKLAPYWPCLLAVGLILLASSCTNPLSFWNDKDLLPYELDPVIQYNGTARPADLDGDGVDEVILWGGTLNQPMHGSSVLLNRVDGRAIEQINVPGEIRSRPLTARLPNGTLDVFIPYVKNDSLFIRCIDHRGSQKFDLFIIAKSNPLTHSERGWDPEVSRVLWVDQNRDGTPELLTHLRAGYALYPRGFLMHDTNSHLLIDSLLMGAKSGIRDIGDLDNDGIPELFVGSHAADNGATMGGFDDAHSYVMIVSIVPSLQIEWHKTTGGRFTSSSIYYDDYDGDGSREFLLSATSNSAVHEPLRLSYMDPETKKIVREIPLSGYPNIRPQAINLDTDGDIEFIATDDKGDIIIFDHYLQPLRTVKSRTTYSSLNISNFDIDNDGYFDIKVNTGSGVDILGENLKPLFDFPSIPIGDYYALRRSPPAKTAYFMADFGNGTTGVYELIPTPFYNVRQFLPKGILLALLALFGGIGIAIARSRKHVAILKRTQDLALDSDSRGILRMTANGTITFSNTCFQRWMHSGKPEHFIEQMKEIASDLLIEPAQPRLKTTLLHFDNASRNVSIMAHPLAIHKNRSQLWLLIIDDLSLEISAEQNKTWGMMAQRVSHDIRTPLTSILLTIQRLQQELEQKNPSETDHYNTYVTRITERIEYLRKLSRNFMKFVETDSPKFVRSNLSEVVEEYIQQYREGKPRDIEINLYQGNHFLVRIDVEQIHSVLDNLLTNALNAMPSGGTITLKLNKTAPLNIMNGAETQEYVVLEISDTGSGIPLEKKNYIFDAGYSGTENGTGLGLSIVKKIVNDHAGHIDFESDVGAGSIFSIYLPIAE